MPDLAGDWRVGGEATGVYRQCHLSAEEFASRRARVMEKIGDGAAILLGTTEPPGEMPLRQGNQFFYLSGVVEPRDPGGRRQDEAVHAVSESAQCAARDVDVRETSMYGPGLSPGDDAGKTAGIDAVLPRSDFRRWWTALPKRAAPSTRRSAPRYRAAFLPATPTDCGRPTRATRGMAAPSLRADSALRSVFRLVAYPAARALGGGLG